MHRNRDGVDPQQAHSLRIAHTNSSSVGQFDFRKAHAFAEDAPFLFRRPLRRQWKKFFQLLDGCLAIHALRNSRNLAAGENFRLKILPN